MSSEVKEKETVKTKPSERFLSKRGSPHPCRLKNRILSTYGLNFDAMILNVSKLIISAGRAIPLFESSSFASFLKSGTNLIVHIGQRASQKRFTVSICTCEGI